MEISMPTLCIPSFNAIMQNKLCFAIKYALLSFILLCAGFAFYPGKTYFSQDSGKNPGKRYFSQVLPGQN